MIKILFVCLGNICRSPLAEAVFKQKVKEKGLERLFFVDSAGTGAYHIGQDPDPRTLQIAEKYGVPIRHKGQQIREADKEKFDYIIAMDSSNYRNIIAILREKPDSLYLMREFDPIDVGGDVPDPYFGENDGFEHVYEILDRSCEELINHLRKKHSL